MERPPGRSFFWLMSDPSQTRRLQETLRALAEPVVAQQGCELVAIELLGGGGGTILRVSVDKPGGSTIEDCTRISRAFSRVLDEADPIGSSYDLEVSTPGIERPLQRESDFARFVGCEARVKLYGGDSRRRIKARLLEVAGGRVRVDVDGEQRTWAIADIERANLILTLEQYARLGQGLHPIAEGAKP